MFVAAWDPSFSSYCNEIDSGFPVAQRGTKGSILYHPAQKSNQIFAENSVFSKNINWYFDYEEKKFF